MKKINLLLGAVIYFVTMPLLASDVEEVIVVGSNTSIGYSDAEYDLSLIHI